MEEQKITGQFQCEVNKFGELKIKVSTTDQFGEKVNRKIELSKQETNGLKKFIEFLDLG